MKKLVLIWVSLVYGLIINAQNLVPNGYFETYSQLPNNPGQWNRCSGWNNCFGDGTPDYFHYAGAGGVELPNAFPSTVNSLFESSAVMGIVLYDESYPDFREYVSTQFTQPLIPGDAYELSFYVTNGNAPIHYGGDGIDHFSVALSTSQLNQDLAGVINFTPQYTYPGTLYSNGWQVVKFDFVADSAYQYVTFGSFVNDSTQQLTNFDTAIDFTEAYYYLDNINLRHSNSTPTGISTIENITQPLKSRKTITYDVLGRVIKDSRTEDYNIKFKY